MSVIDPFDEYRSGGLGPQPVVGTGDRPADPAPTMPSDFVFCPDHDAIFLAFMQLLPTGAAWDNMELSYERSSVIRQFMSGIALSWMHFEDSMCVALDEWFCQSSMTDLDLWRRDFGVPDECELYNQSLCAKVQANGPATAEYLLGLMQASGYEATGRWLKGDDIQFPGVHSTFYVLIDTTISPAYQLQPALRFPLGSGHTLGDVDITNIQCMLERYIPAHCVAVVGTAGEFEPESLGIKLRYWWAAEDKPDGPLASWSDRIAAVAATTPGAQPVSALDPSGNRYVSFSRQGGTYLRTPAVNVPPSGNGKTAYVALWSQLEQPAKPGDWLLGEPDGFTIDFLYDGVAKVAVKTAGAVTEWEPDDFIANSGGANVPKLIWDADGRLVWVPHNLTQQSENLNSTWTFTNATAPTPTFLLPNTTSGYHRVQAPVLNGLLGETYTWSATVKAGGYSKCGVMELTQTGTEVCYDLATGTVITQNGGATGTITDVGGGEFFLTATVTIASGSACRFNFYVLSPAYAPGSAITTVWVPDGVSGINVYAQQTNRGITPTDYLKTTTIGRCGIALDHDPMTGALRGLLTEPTVTNILLWNCKLDDATWSKSNLTVVANAIAAPTGLLDADKIVETTTPTVQHLAGRTTAMVVTTATQYCFSAYLKPAGRTWVMLWDNQAPNSGVWFNLSGAGTVGTRQAANQRASITQLPNGWYRCEMTYTTVTTTAQAYIVLADADNSSSYTGDGVSGVYVWGAQYEAGNFASSPIRTFTGTSARVADTPTILTSQLPWSNTEATVYSESIPRDIAAATYIWDMYLDASHRAVGQYASGTLRLANVTTSTDVSLNGPAMVAGAKQKLTCSLKTNDYAMSVAGGVVQTDLGATFNAGMTKFGLGTYSAGSLQQNGWLERITWVPRKVPNAELPTWRYNYVAPSTRVLVSRGVPGNFRRLGTKLVGDHQVIDIASSATDELIDTNPATTLTGPIIGAAGFETNLLIGRVFGTYTTPPEMPATGTDVQTTSPITIGANVATPPGENVDANLYHLMVCVDLTPSEYLQLEAWLAWHINRPDILDGSHPFRNIRP